MNQEFNVTQQQLLDLIITQAKLTFGDRLVTLFKFGSLGKRGGFSLCSDIDIALFLDEIKTEDYSTITTLVHKLRSSGLAFAKELSLFWSCYDNTLFTKGVGRFPPLDRLDLLEYGILLCGSDQRSQLEKPSHAELIISSAQFISTSLLTEEKLVEITEQPAAILAKGARYFTKWVLFPVRMIFTLENPNKIATNKEAVDYFNQHYPQNLAPEILQLVNFAYALRAKPADYTVAIDEQAMQNTLLQLYRYLIQRYKDEIITLNEPSLALQLELQLSYLAPSSNLI